VELGAEIILHGIEDFADLDDAEEELYFTHSDHLGSSSFITDASGEAVQHLQYLPFGEHFVSQTSSGWESRYTFSGKEKDVETGYSYFGARYYDSDLSIWLSVDPLADKYPSMSAYMYTAGNPVNIIDPDGNYLFGLFGSTKDQRRAAKEFQSKHGGEIVNYHKRSICVSYRQLIGFVKSGATINESYYMMKEQYFNKNGTLVPQGDRLSAHEPNKLEELRNKTNSEDANVLLKAAGNIGFSMADGLSVYVTSLALVQDITGLAGSVNIDGTLVQNNNELLDKGLDGFTSIGLGAISAGSKTLLKGAPGYSKYADKKNWTKDLSRDTKEFYRDAVNKSANQNIESKKYMKKGLKAGTILNEIHE